MTTRQEFVERERQCALAFAPLEEIDETFLRAELGGFPLSALRLAALRWSAPRGRARPQVIDGIVSALNNPHLNQGDSFRVALGHIRACHARAS